MKHASPYTLLRAANSLDASMPMNGEQPAEPAWTDLQALAARWSSLQARPANASNRPYIAPSPSSSPPASQQQDAGAPGPPMRTPPPMHPPIAYPTDTHLYGIPSVPSQPTRHAYYDSIIKQHKNASQKAVFVAAALE